MTGKARRSCYTTFALRCKVSAKPGSLVTSESLNRLHITVGRPSYPSWIRARAIPAPRIAFDWLPIATSLTFNSLGRRAMKEARANKNFAGTVYALELADLRLTWLLYSNYYTVSSIFSLLIGQFWPITILCAFTRYKNLCFDTPTLLSAFKELRLRNLVSCVSSTNY